MPIPTDTFWNIKRLNIVFAVSSIALVGTILWSVIQDFDKTWRKPQRSGRVWEAALTEEKILRMMSPAEEERLNELKALLAELDGAVKSGNADYRALATKVDRIEKKHADEQALSASDLENLAQIKAALAGIEAAMADPAKQAAIKKVPDLNRQIEDYQSRVDTATFKLNNYKAELTVAEGQLQQAITSGNTERQKELQAEVELRRNNVRNGDGKSLTGDEQIASWNDEIRKRKEERGAALKEIDELRKLTAKLGGDVELLRKKVHALDPDKIPGVTQLLAKGSEHLRQAPLMQFINPAEKVQQIVLPDVLTDVSFMKIETIDRCTTCHIYIDRREFSEENILRYLEEQLATSRNVRFLPADAPGDPTADSPGAMGMPEFWHAYARSSAPEAVSRSAERIAALAAPLGKGLEITVGTGKVNEFKYEGKAEQDLIVGELLKAWSMFEPGAKAPANGKNNGAIRSGSRRVEVTIQPTVDAEMAKAAREAAFAHAGEMRKAVRAALDKKAWNQLEERYRYSLVDAVNVHRSDRGWQPLDASAMLLAHPRLDLYAEQDSPHPKERLGCTACHDGSGQETNFVLAAHAPRAQWVDDQTGVPVLPSQVLSEVKDEHHADMSNMLETVLSNGISDLHFSRLAGDHHDNHATTQPAESHEKAQAKSVVPPNAKPVRYFEPLTGTERRAMPQAAYWKKKHEWESGTSFTDVNHYWDWPMREPQYIEANCARCHTNIHDIKEEAPTLYAGRVLFAKNGCVNCHQMDSVPVDDRRQVGPDLRHVTSKLSEAFLHSWIWAPKAFRPSTRMPHFFMLENNSSDEELRRTQQEVRAIAFYLQKTATPAKPSEILSRAENKMPAADDSEAAVEERINRGRALFIGLEGTRDAIAERQAGVGCLGCHTNLNETGREWIINDLIKTGKVDIAAIRAEMTQRSNRAPTNTQLNQEVQRRARAQYDGMTYNERHLYAAESLGEQMSSDELPKYDDGTIKPVFQHHGPELSGIGTKLLAGGRGKQEARKWLYDWLLHPQHYHATSVMPRLRLTPDEALDLTEYLLAQTRKKQKADDDWEAKTIAGDTAKVSLLVADFLKSSYSLDTARKKAVDEEEMSKRAALALTNAATPTQKAKEIVSKLSLEEKQLAFLGSKLIAHYGCMSCHAINGMEGVVSPCTNLSDWGQKAITKLAFEFTDHHNVEALNEAAGGLATAKIPMVNGLSTDAVRKVIDHLNAKKFAEPVSHDAAVAWPHVDHSRTSWLEQKLKNTRIYDRGRNLLDPKRKMDAGKPVLDANGNPEVVDPGKPYEKLRMPTFYFNDAEVHALVTFVISNRDKLIAPALLARVNHEQSVKVAQGRQIAERYNCVGCHRIEDNTPAIQQYWLSEITTGTARFTYFLKDDAPAKAPPSLRSEGAKAQGAWIHHFLQNVEGEGTVQKELDKERRRLRPLPFVRMPSFPLSDAESSALAAYFHAAAAKEARQHDKRLTPLLVDAAKAQSTTTQPVAPADVWPDDAWFTQVTPGSVEPRYQALAAYLKEWALEHTLAKPADFAPDQTVEALAKAYKLALFDARFVARALHGDYPFTEQFRPTPDPQRFKKGEMFFHYLQCHTCHVMGDDKNPKVNQAPKAPNLTNAYRRLQRDWMRNWIQEPQTIQPGNPMPAIFFSGRGIPAVTDPNRAIYELHGLPHLTSSPTPELAKQIQAAFGETVQEQTDLLMDYIYYAGISGHTSEDPPVGEPKLAAPAVSYKPQPIPGITAPLPEPVKKAAPEAPKAPSAAPTQQMATGPSIVGKVLFDGTPPVMKPVALGAVAACAALHPSGSLADDSLVVGPNKGVKYTVVYVTKGLSGRFPLPSAPAVLDQKGCRYEPHVLPVMAGQQVLVKNSDPFLHNVNGLPELNPRFNFGQNNINPGQPIPTPTRKENFRVKCDVHPWMNAHFVVLDHPFFALTGDDGSFTINGLPPGDYTITTWHEKCPPVEMAVKVEAGTPADVTLSVKLEQP